MKNRLNLLLLLILIVIGRTSAQDQDPVLFSVGDENIHTSEFKYVYEKSIGADADYDENSVLEFLDLYQQFKLKVIDAKARKLEESSDLQAELEMYREQLADKYMSDHSVLNTLTKELYDRMKWEIDVSHILVRLSEQASEEVKKLAYDRILAAKREIDAGRSFEEVALAYSQDRSVSDNKGNLGYRRAMLPDGLYDLETVIYETPVGEVSDPVRSRLGYHIVKVHDKRESAGNLEIRHILIRNNPGDQVAAQEEITRIHMMLQEGQDFEEVAKKYSQDNNTKEEGGYLGVFSLGTYAPEFEEAAYALEKDNDFSKPVKTQFGWHIIQRVSGKKLGNYEDEKQSLENLIRTDSRYELAKHALISDIKEQEGFVDYEVDPSDVVEWIGGDIYRYEWKAPEKVEAVPMFRLRDQEYDLVDFIEYLNNNRDVRMSRTSDNFNPVSGMKVVMDRFVEDSVLEFEKAHLEEKYPEFREIMREYREGILLFEISRERIWDRAGSDAEELQKYFEENRDEYHHPHQLALDDYVVRTSQPRVLKKIRKQITRRSPERVLKKFNKAAQVVSHEEVTMEEKEWADAMEVDPSEIKQGYVAEKVNEDEGWTKFSKIRTITFGEPLEFEEARGVIMSDYQKYLEKQWVDELREQYEIKVDEEVLQSIVQS